MTSFTEEKKDEEDAVGGHLYTLYHKKAMRVVTKKASENPKFTIVERTQNFHWDMEGFEKWVRFDPVYFMGLEKLKNEMVAFGASDIANDMEYSDLLCDTFSQMYLDEMQGLSPPLVFALPLLGDNIMEAALFTTLCTFLHTSNRIKGESLRDFVLHNHPLRFYDIESPDFRTNFLDDEADKLRQFRHRLFSKREVYIKDSQWAAMPKDSKHEWSFYFALNGEGENRDLSETVRDTFKRIKNLYSDIDKALVVMKESEYEKRLMGAYKKFMSKLEKIKYENYLELQKAISFQLSKDKSYYGINIYRLEKEMRPYITIHEVKRLSSCQSVDEENDILGRFICLKDIYFPKIYEFFARLPICDMEKCAKAFPQFLQNVTVSSCLILDELVETGIFGEQWENLFQTTINEMADSVFYDPNKLDYIVTTESQENFVDLISAPVNFLVYSQTGIFPCV